MPQVSRRRLEKDVQVRIQELFYDAFKHAQSNNSLSNFVNDLLTDTEKKMVSKRLAIAYLLLQEYPYRVIADLLKVSTTTVGRVKLVLDEKGAGYRSVLIKMAKQQEFQEKWSKIEYMISTFMPIHAGRNFGQIRKRAVQKRKAQSKPF